MLNFFHKNIAEPLILLQFCMIIFFFQFAELKLSKEKIILHFFATKGNARIFVCLFRFCFIHALLYHI